MVDKQPDRGAAQDALRSWSSASGGLGYLWLPDHHLPVAATLAHADELIAEVADILFAYQGQPEGIVQLREVRLTKTNQLLVSGISPIPRKVPLLVTDVLVTLRNAIEHTLFAEIEHRDGELVGKTAKVVEMPAAQTYLAFVAWVKAREKNGSPSLQRGSEVLRRIELLQPFHRLKDPEAHPMSLLALHTNFSKHRAPAVTAVGIRALHREDVAPPSKADVLRRSEKPVQVGDIIAELPNSKQIPMVAYPTIGLQRPGTDRWPVLMKELDTLSNWVRLQAVPRLITGDEPPKPVLPPRFDIVNGHDDERTALDSGAELSAAQLHSDRLGARTVRSDMVITLSQMEGAPVTDQISDWLESLSDQAMLTRMRQLKVDTTRNPRILMHNFAVLEGMIEDARTFPADS